MTFNEAKLQQINAVGAHRIYGHALEFDQNAADVGGVSARKRWRPIRPCLCVQDSSDNPCPCDSGMIWWLSEDAVIAQGNSGRKDQHGKELQFFDVHVDSKIMVESLKSVSVGALKSLGNSITSERICDLTGATDGSGVPGTMQSAVGAFVSVGLNILASIIYDACKQPGFATKVNDAMIRIINDGGPFPPK